MAGSGEYNMLIDGKAVSASETLDVVNPATEEVVGRIPDASRDDLDRAVAAARKAYPGWSAKPIDERRAVLYAISQRVAENADVLMRLLTSEQGKPHEDARGEVEGASQWIAAVATLDPPVNVPEDTPERRVETRRVPLGVVGAIVPWNFPVLLAMFKIAPALLTGNTMVLKPSPFTPLSTLKIGELIADLVPPGVLNIVSGGDRLGPWLTEHPGIDKVSFTGSSQTGRKVMESASHTLKRVTLELGGNDPAIVMPDVDVEKVAEDLFWAAFRNNGQICIASKRMYVHKDVYEPLRDALVAYAKTVKIGDGSEQGTQIGPINNRAQYERVLDLIEDSKTQGYRFALGGEQIDTPGYFIPVTIIDNPPEDSRIVREEQFGPVLPLLKYEDYDDVVARANDTDYGLGASVWGSDIDRATAIAERIASGMVWVNESQYVSPMTPFGGMKQSGIGVEGGIEGLLEYTAAQNIIVRKVSAPA